MNVKLIAHTKLSDKFYYSLDDKVQHGIWSEVSDGQAVALTAIRTCYSHLPPSEILNNEFHKYFGSKATDGKGGTEADRLIRHIMNSGHCYDDKTEVLTNKGFVLFKDLTPEHEVAMVNKNGEFEGFTKDYFYVEYDKNEHEGYIYDFESKHLSFGVTSKHRMFISPGRHLKKWEIKLMEDINYKEYRVARVPKKRKNPPKRTNYSLNQLKFIGFFIGDGYADSRRRVTFHLKKDRKKDYLEKLLSDLDGVTRWEKRESYDGRHKYIVFIDFINPLDFYKNRQKTLNGLHLLEGDEFESLLEGLMNSDGSYTKSNKTTHYCTNSEILEEEICTLLTINGIPHKKDGYCRISIQKEKSLYPFVKDSRSPEREPKKIKYTGKTYCVQVPTGVLVVRRNDKTLVCGNTSTMEHITFTFAIEGVSRSLLAQLTRHRHFSFSVQSQRYVKLESGSKSGGVGYVVPKTIKNKGLETRFKYEMEKIQGIYDTLREHGVPAEDARYILPNAATCNLVLTGNLRSILEFYSKRNPNTHAQWEIQDLAERMKDEIIRVETWLKPFFK